MIVVWVKQGSIAERAGIQENDIIVRIQGVKITSANELKAQLSLLKKGQGIEMNALRNGEIITLNIII